MKVCLVHDYLNQLGGAERTLKAIHEIWPGAPIYTSLVDWGVVDKLDLPRNLIRYPRWLHIPLVSSFYKYFILFYPLVFKSFDLSEYDLVISSSANFAKGIVSLPSQIHINYCHTPPRFLYHLPTETNRRSHWFWGKLLMPVDFLLRMWDFTAARRVDYFVANSENVARRIKKWYRRNAIVIYPPVDIFDKANKLMKLKANEAYYLVVSRLSAYKNVDLAIRACAELGTSLKVAGTGPEEGRLNKLAKQLHAPVEFAGFVSDAELSSIYGNCKALISTVLEEDFGIVPLEAMSFGKPVIALRSGGVEETVTDGETGLFYSDSTVESLVGAIRKFESVDYFTSVKCSRACRQQAERFSKERFKREFREFVEKIANDR